MGVSAAQGKEQIFTVFCQNLLTHSPELLVVARALVSEPTAEGTEDLDRPQPVRPLTAAEMDLLFTALEQSPEGHLAYELRVLMEELGARWGDSVNGARSFSPQDIREQVNAALSKYPLLLNRVRWELASFQVGTVYPAEVQLKMDLVFVSTPFAERLYTSFPGVRDLIEQILKDNNVFDPFVSHHDRYNNFVLELHKRSYLLHRYANFLRDLHEGADQKSVSLLSGDKKGLELVTNKLRKHFWPDPNVPISRVSFLPDVVLTWLERVRDARFSLNQIQLESEESSDMTFYAKSTQELGRRMGAYVQSVNGFLREAYKTKNLNGDIFKDQIADKFLPNFDFESEFVIEEGLTGMYVPRPPGYEEYLDTVRRLQDIIQGAPIQFD